MRLNQGNSLKTLASMKASVSVFRAAPGGGGGATLSSTYPDV